MKIWYYKYKYTYLGKQYLDTTRYGRDLRIKLGYFGLSILSDNHTVYNSSSITRVLFNLHCHNLPINWLFSITIFACKSINQLCRAQWSVTTLAHSHTFIYYNI